MLDKLKRRLPADADVTDELLMDLLEDATQYVLNYTGRKVIPDALRGVVCELAATSYNLLGLEGSTNHSEGGVSDGLQPVSDKITKQLLPWRVARVG